MVLIEKKVQESTSTAAVTMRSNCEKSFVMSTSWTGSQKGSMTSSQHSSSLSSSSSSSSSSSRIVSKSSKKSLTGADEELVNKTKLIPVDCTFGTVTENSLQQITFASMLVKERYRLTSKRDSGVMVVFAIRRPGCASCRINGRILTTVLAEENVGCIGIIKETNVDNDALVTLYSKYFRHPIYKDNKWRIYEAMGNRRISIWKFLSTSIKLAPTYKKQNVENVPLGGDLLTQGGVLVFDKNGILRYTYYEKYGEYFDPEQLRNVINDAKQPIMNNGYDSTSGSDC